MTDLKDGRTLLLQSQFSITRDRNCDVAHSTLSISIPIGPANLLQHHQTPEALLPLIGGAFPATLSLSRSGPGLDERRAALMRSGREEARVAQEVTAILQLLEFV